MSILAAGVLLTLIFAWPLMVAGQWFTHATGWIAWRSVIAWPAEADRVGSGSSVRIAGGRVEAVRGILSERFRIFPSDVGTPGNPSPGWPRGELVLARTDGSRTSPGQARSLRLPSTVAGPPPEDEAMRWGRIDTVLAGFPFRCFRSEERRAARSWSPAGIEIDPEADFRNAIEFGAIGEDFLVLPLRPIWPGLVADVLFWSAVTWAAFFVPRSWRTRRRRRRGLCVACGEPLQGSSTCLRCGGDGGEFAGEHPLAQPEMLHQTAYIWFVLVSALDVMLTWKILQKGGEEVNPVAREVIELWGFEGAIVFKFAIVVWVVIACELAGRRRPRTGRWLSWTAVAISAAPVVYSLGLLLDHLVLRPSG